MNENKILQMANRLDEIKQKKLHIHCITNNVAQNFSANILLALNITPSMTLATNEIKQFAKQANGLLINLGTIDETRTKAIKTILPLLKNITWGLDPVFVNVSSKRLQLAKKLLQYKPTFVRCNELEAKALFGNKLNNVDTCIIVNGKIDKIFYHKQKTIHIENGHKFMQQITAMGCSLGAVLCAFACIDKNININAACACALFGLAGERAAKKSSGTGTFSPNFIDELQNINSQTIMKKAKIYEM